MLRLHTTQVNKTIKRSKQYATTLARPTRRVSIATPPKAATLTIDLVQSSYFIGQGIILFTMFYCTTNWWFYRRVREDIEKKQKPPKK